MRKASERDREKGCGMGVVLTLKVKLKKRNGLTARFRRVGTWQSMNWPSERGVLHASSSLDW